MVRRAMKREGKTGEKGGRGGERGAEGGFVESVEAKSASVLAPSTRTSTTKVEPFHHTSLETKGSNYGPCIHTSKYW